MRAPNFYTLPGFERAGLRRRDDGWILERFADPASRHPDERIIAAKAGSVLVFNGHLWHSGTTNKSSRSRRVVQCLFVGRDEVRFSRIKVDSPERLSSAARHILGV